MGLFEFVTVMVSMILALCLGDLLRNVSFLAKTDREVALFLSPGPSGTGAIDLRAHFTRVQRLFSLVLAAYTVFMWFDGPLFTEQRVFGPVGLMHAPILAACLVPSLTGNYRANVIAPSSVIGALLLVMALRYTGS